MAVAAAAGLLCAAVPGTAEAQTTWTVRPGQSIQAAVNRAQSGDTIKIAAGTYAEAVCIVGKGLTIKGVGPNDTILVPPATSTTTPCWVPGSPEGSATEDVSAIKFLNPNKPVVVKDLQTRRHPESGIVVWRARGMTVKNTKGVGHPRYGILASADSRDVVIKDNLEQGVEVNGRSGTAGISIGDSAHARAVVKNNRAEGLNLGIFVRESRTGALTDNTVTGNCVGVLVFDDANTERPNTSGTVIGGDWDVIDNRSVANNRFCLAGRDGSLRVSGVGMAVVNADDVTVRGNLIRDNQPSVPANTLNFPAAGLSLLTVPSPTGGPDPGPVTNVRVVGNTFRNNVPLDILLGQPSSNIVFRGNSCASSSPASICQG